MPLPRIAADAFGVVTISLVAVFVVLGLLCICYSIYFRSRTRRQGFVQYSFFSGPWITRISFILVAIWWGCGEIVRLTFLKGEGRLFIAEKWQEVACKFYVISNIGFAEPCLFLILVFLLHASLKKDFGALSPRWNGRTIGYVLLFCIPMFLIQLVLVLFGPKFNKGQGSHDTKRRKYFTSTSSLISDGNGNQMACTYPLLNTLILGLFDCLLIGYITYIGYRMVSLVINKGLQRRIYVLSLSVIALLSMRVCILGISVLPRPGGLVFEVLVFLAFLTLLLCAAVGICILVYCPVADALALERVRHEEFEEMIPFDDYYDNASPVVNYNRLEVGRNSDASTKRGSISFRTMIKDDMLPLSDFDEISVLSPGNNLRTPSPSASPLFPGRPVQQLCGVPEL